MKACRKYLVHVQKSVFEGEITEGKLALLKKEIEKIIDKKTDFIIIYAVNDGVKINREILSQIADPADNFL